MPDFDRMTLDEIDAWNVAKKRELLALQEEYRTSNDARHRKVLEALTAEAVKQVTAAAEASGRTIDEQVLYWLTDEAQSIVNGIPDPGRRNQAQLVLASKGGAR